MSQQQFIRSTTKTLDNLLVPHGINVRLPHNKNESSVIEMAIYANLAAQAFGDTSKHAKVY